MSSFYGCHFSENRFSENMSARHARQWNSRHGVAAVATAMPAQNSSMREMVIVARETVMVLMIQIAFRAALLLRRWNY